MAQKKSMRLFAALLILPASVAAILWLAATRLGGSPQATTHTPEDDLGRQVYNTRCISCHQANGTGITGYFPPLDGTEWVSEEKGRLIRILLHGMTGPTTIQGVDYNGAMPSWGPVLSDAEIAAVLTYIRGSWSNQAPPVFETDVAAVRGLTSARNTPWKHDELQQVENLGVPGDSNTETDTTERGDGS